MGFLPAEKLPDDPAALELRRDAKATIDAYRAFLANPAFAHNLDLAVLAKVAADENVAPRERRRAAEVLGKYRLKALEMMATLTGAREQSLKTLGLEQGPSQMALTQVNQKIEIVRAVDWRAAPALADGEVVVEAAALPAENASHQGNGHAEAADGADPSS